MPSTKQSDHSLPGVRPGVPGSTRWDLKSKARRVQVLDTACATIPPGTGHHSTMTDKLSGIAFQSGSLFAVTGSSAAPTCGVHRGNTQTTATLAAAGLIQQIKNLPSVSLFDLSPPFSLSVLSRAAMPQVSRMPYLPRDSWARSRNVESRRTDGGSA